jgi:hypothetical protein
MVSLMPVDMPLAFHNAFRVVTFCCLSGMMVNKLLWMYVVRYCQILYELLGPMTNHCWQALKWSIFYINSIYSKKDKVDSWLNTCIQQLFFFYGRETKILWSIYCYSCFMLLFLFEWLVQSSADTSKPLLSGVRHAMPARPSGTSSPMRMATRSSPRKVAGSSSVLTEVQQNLQPTS